MCSDLSLYRLPVILLESSNLEIERNLSLFAMIRFLRGLKPVLPALTTAPVFLQQRESQSRAPLHRPGILYFQCFAKHGFFIKSLFKLAPVGSMEPELPSDEDIFNAMRELCQSIPDAILSAFGQETNSRGSKSYWMESALRKGFRNSEDSKGIVFCPENQELRS